MREIKMIDELEIKFLFCFGGCYRGARWRRRQTTLWSVLIGTLDKSRGSHKYWWDLIKRKQRRVRESPYWSRAIAKPNSWMNDSCHKCYWFMQIINGCKTISKQKGAREIAKSAYGPSRQAEWLEQLIIVVKCTRIRLNNGRAIKALGRLSGTRRFRESIKIF